MMETQLLDKEEREKLLIEGCETMAKENLKITKDFENIEDFEGWEW